MKRLIPILLCLAIITGLCPATVLAAPAWPGGISIGAESGIVMDADSGAVLWGQNINNTYYPASITKVMTALIVLEQCNLDDTITFSYDAVHNVEKDSSNASISTGDQLSVRECLYALLLKSANEAANALAEHISGSREDFAKLMNKRAKELGCLNTHFSNPSGLNDEAHYTSAYDMALITKVAFNNPTFVEIASTLYHVLPPTKLEPEGLGISPGHQMLKKNTAYYYSSVVCGKTGYTTLAGNTLVTCAERDGMRLVCVILNGSKPQHYKDTKTLLDFGFNNFHSLKIADYDTTYSTVKNDMMIGGLPIQRPDALILDPDRTLTLPKNAEFSDAKAELTYDLTEADPQDAAAKIQYTYNDRYIGCTYLKINEHINDPAPSAETPQAEALQDETTTAPVKETEPPATSALVVTRGSSEEETPVETTAASPNRSALPSDVSKKPFSVPSAVWIILLAVIAGTLLIGGLVAFKLYLNRKEELQRLERREKRLKRLRDSGYSAEEFDAIMEQRRSSLPGNHRPRKHKRK